MASKKKPTVVNRAFLLGLADSIYDPKTRRFLRLCNGTLQNGPDPTNPQRSMHCGLGELYFAMTGHQPEQDHVNEANVVDLAVDLSRLQAVRDKRVNEAIAVIKALGLPEGVANRMVNVLERESAYATGEFGEDEACFREALEDVPDANDDGCDADECRYDTYRSRSARVARQLRKAATFLPG